MTWIHSAFPSLQISLPEWEAWPRVLKQSPVACANQHQPHSLNRRNVQTNKLQVQTESRKRDTPCPLQSNHLEDLDSETAPKEMERPSFAPCLRRFAMVQLNFQGLPTNLGNPMLNFLHPHDEDAPRCAEYDGRP